jgi:hypothetical protein
MMMIVVSVDVYASAHVVCIKGSDSASATETDAPRAHIWGTNVSQAEIISKFRAFLLRFRHRDLGSLVYRDAMAEVRLFCVRLWLLY